MRGVLISLAMTGCVAAIDAYSDRKEPVRIVVTVTRGEDPNVSLNQLFQVSALQDSFGVGMLALLASRAAADHQSARAAGVSTREVASLYWQFVDLVWVVVFTVLYRFPPGVTHG